jgi:tetrahydromethanopterin S-methyltransferase subunit C
MDDATEVGVGDGVEDIAEVGIGDGVPKVTAVNVGCGTSVLGVHADMLLTVRINDR